MRTLRIFPIVFILLCGQVVTEPEESDIDVHEALFVEHKYPSAKTCQVCHAVHYKQWSVSPHSYAQISPVFNTMQGKITKLTNGSKADFCIRCDTAVGMNRKGPIFAGNFDRPPVSREGVTCIVCHRRPQAYGKVSGRLPVAPGDIFDPVYGPNGNEELNRVIQRGEYDIRSERGKERRAIHGEVKKSPQITSAGFCGSCHDVNHVFGFRLEEAFSEYKASPAAKKGISCQHCHMGIEPGVPSGYSEGPAAIVGGKPTAVHKLTNHMFVGPDYSTVHPGIIPHNPAAPDIATLHQWLKFNFAAGWGTDKFEGNVEEDYRPFL